MATNIDIHGTPISRLPRESNPAGVDVSGVKSGRTVKVSLDLVATKDEVNNIENNRKGYFATIAELKTVYPNPKVGWYAYVGSTGTIWKEFGGVWVDSSEPIPNDVDLSLYAKKTDLAIVESKAMDAAEKSEIALATANNASDNSNLAITKANDAINTASGAVTIATNADTKATTAQSEANKAIGDSTTALATANRAIAELAEVDKWIVLTIPTASFNGQLYRFVKISILGDNQYYGQNYAEIGTFEIDLAQIIEQNISTGMYLFSCVIPLGFWNPVKPDPLYARFDINISLDRFITITPIQTAQYLQYKITLKK